LEQKDKVSNKVDISAVVPVYNSEAMLAKLLERLHQTLPCFANNFEIILVNDGSLDSSWEKIKQLSKQYPNVVGVNLERNFGQHNALLCGVRLAKYPVTVTLDDDLQNPPEEIPKLLAELNIGCDLVYGCPSKMGHALWRNFSSVLVKRTISLLTAMALHNTSSFRAFRTKLRNSFAHYNSPYVSLDILLVKSARCIKYVEVKHAEREQGASNYNLKRLILHSLNLLFGCSIVPLRIISVLGILTAGAGFLLFLYVIIHYFIAGKVVPGFTFLSAIIALFAGTQLLTLGIIGEYIGRIHLRLMDYPTYTIDETIGSV